MSSDEHDEHDEHARDEVIAEVTNLGKCYHVYERPSHRLLQGLVGRSRTFYKEFWALRNVDLIVRRGETLGIIGKNGSGKSTLLQMIAGTLNPTEGDVRVSGKVAALLELGSGFNPEFTGRENVYLNAAIFGLTKSTVDARISRIIEFADIGDFIDRPVRMYSSGMAVRLAFAVIAHVDADVLIVDEALSVGDAFFAQKCMRFLEDFKKNGTLIFVSHDTLAVTSLCKRALWLEDGIPRMSGSAREVAEAYLAEQHAASHTELPVPLRDIPSQAITPQARTTTVSVGAAPVHDDGPDPRYCDAAVSGPPRRIEIFEFDPEKTGKEFGVGGASISTVWISSDDGRPVRVVEGGERVTLNICVKLNVDLDRVIMGFYLKNRLGQRLFGDNTYQQFVDSPLKGLAGDTLTAKFTFRMPTMPSGSYMVDAAVASGTQQDHVQQQWLHDALEIRSVDETMRHGMIGIPMLAVEVSREHY